MGVSSVDLPPADRGWVDLDRPAIRLDVKAGEVVYVAKELTVPVAERASVVQRPTFPIST